MSYLTISGNVAGDPELRFTPAGKAYAKFSVAENRKWKDAQGADQEATTWHRCVAWGQLGEHIADSVSKGMKVLCYGRLDQRDWETDAGEKRTAFEVSVTDLGPSLMFATAKVEKIERPSGGGTRQGPPDYTDEPF